MKDSKNHNKAEKQATVSGSELIFNDIENILWAICYTEVIGREKKDDDLIDRARKAQRSLHKVREKLKLSGETLRF